MQDAVHLTLATPESTERLAALLAPVLVAGDTVLLSGPIGAGKTHFARSVIQTRLKASGRMEDVPSPTFTLVQTYDDGVTEIWHADLYRLTSSDEVIELGLDDAFETAVTLVEWPDRLGEGAPGDACRITFTPDGEGRSVRVVWGDLRRDTWLASFQEGA